MATSALFKPAREKFLTAQMSWVTGVLRGVFLIDSITVDLGWEFLSDIPASARVAISLPVAGRSAVDGVAAGNAVEFPVLLDTRLVSQCVLFKDSGVESTSQLVALLTGDGLVSGPFIPQGLQYFVYPDLATGGFFRL